MKRYDCFFPSYVFRKLRRENFSHFKMALLTYDNIFVPAFTLNQLLTEEIQIMCDTQTSAILNTDMLKLIDANTFFLFEKCLDHDLDATKKLIRSKHLMNVYSDLSLHYHDKFLKEVFMDIPDSFASNCPSTELFKEILDYFGEYFPNTMNNGFVELLSIWILRSGEAACPAVTEPPVRTDGATRLLSITPVHRGECHRLHALNGLSLDPLPEC